MVQHLAVIMDGNRRWAKRKNLLPWFGHLEGTKSVKNLIEFCLEQKIPILSVYTFSIENFGRSIQEINFIFSILIEEAAKELSELIKNEINVRFIGDKFLFPKEIISTIDKLEESTKTFKRLSLNIIFCYGGKQEIVQAAKSLAQDVKNGNVTLDSVNETTFERYLWTAGMPEPELIIRTGGASRLSNFMLYKAAYSELYFINSLWPDLTKSDLQTVFNDFDAKKRNFGK